MKKILIITDSSTHQKTDDIFPLATEFKKLGNEVYILDRAFPENSLFFSGEYQTKLSVYNIFENHFTFFSYKNNNMNRVLIQKTKIDLILLRIDRPVSDELLLHIENYFLKKPIINKPSGVIETASKEFLFLVKDVCPPMRLCKTYNDIIEFSKLFPIVIKPLKGYGGKDICRILNNKYYHENKEITEKKFKEIIKSLLKIDGKVIAVEYLKNIYLGDKRIYVVNGNIIGATNRIPKENSWIGNVQQGAKVEKTKIDTKETFIISKINKVLHDKGIYVYGADILIDNNMNPILSEINTLNVGGCHSIDRLYNSSCIKTVVNSLMKIIEN